MGKSSASCLKILACGSDSVDHDDLQTPETKGSSDRRGWSFRKRSARHRVLSNSVVSESPSSVNKSPPPANKGPPDSAAVSFLVQPDVTVPEKTSVIQPDLAIPEKTSVVQPDLTKPEKTPVVQPDLTKPEKTSVVLPDLTKPEKTSVVQPDLTVPEKTCVIQPTEEEAELAVQPDSKLSDAIASGEGECEEDASLDEHSIIIIQAAVRRLLAQRLLLKQQNIIKLQAAVRGHIVRNHAIGTLRCVQAIIKMQALVRARRARLHADESGDFVKQSVGKDNNDSTFQNEKRPKPNGTYTYVSIEKLLGNAFARQLMESIPRTKSMNIKCEPLKSDSAWNWLERWMSVSTVTKEEPYESESDAEQHKEILISDGEQHKESLEYSEGKEEISVPYDCYTETDIKSGVDASIEASENVGNLMRYEENNLDLHSSKPISPSSSHSELQNIELSDSRPNIAQSAPIEIKETDLTEKVEGTTYLSEKDDTGNKQDIPDVNFQTEEKSEIEVKKISRKSSNPAFIAAQSKFEEMSSSATSPKLNTSSSDEAEAASSLDKNSSSADQPFKSRDIGVTDCALNVESMNHSRISECGTELSIPSTLDSLNRSYAEVNTIEEDTKVSEEIDHPRTKEDSKLEAVEKPIIQETNPSYTNTNKLEGDENVNLATQVPLNSITAADSPNLEKKPEADTNGASPRKNTPGSESQASPSSQMSAKTRKGKAEKTESTLKKKSSSADNKKSPIQNKDSGLEHKTAKRRNSFGSAKPDPKEHEPRDSSSSNSLPSYMQATQSAKAKAIAHGSPRSSPDVHEKEIYIKKRQSLPGADERQGSPRIQHSLSQGPQNAKGNGIHSPQDRKWRR